MSDINEELQEAVKSLMQCKWVLQQNQPDEFFRISRYENILRKLFREKFGWNLIGTARLYKLEKTPASSKSYMGISEMQSSSDYALLCCVMAFLEERELDRQFLLGELCEAVIGYYPSDAVNHISWEDYNWRKALIRVLKYLADNGAIKVIDDQSSDFIKEGFYGESKRVEALYEVGLMSRYVMRMMKRDISAYKNSEEFMENELKVEAYDGEMSTVNRQNVYRRLLLQPVVNRSEINEAEINYLRHQYGNITADFQKYFELDFEQYFDAAMLVSQERSSFVKNEYPNQRNGIHNIILLLSSWFAENSDLVQKADLSLDEFKNQLKKFKSANMHGWTKEYKDMKLDKLFNEIVSEMKKWEMIALDDEIVTLKPGFYRIRGNYAQEKEQKINK